MLLAQVTLDRAPRPTQESLLSVVGPVKVAEGLQADRLFGMQTVSTYDAPDLPLSIDKTEGPTCSVDGANPATRVMCSVGGGQPGTANKPFCTVFKDGKNAECSVVGGSNLFCSVFLDGKAPTRQCTVYAGATTADAWCSVTGGSLNQCSVFPDGNNRNGYCSIFDSAKGNCSVSANAQNSVCSVIGAAKNDTESQCSVFDTDGGGECSVEPVTNGLPPNRCTAEAGHEAQCSAQNGSKGHCSVIGGGGWTEDPTGRWCFSS